MAPRLTLVAALLLGSQLAAAQSPSPEAAAESSAASILQSVSKTEKDAQDRATAALQRLRGLDVDGVVREASPWHSVDELEARAEEAFKDRREKAQKELGQRLRELQELPRRATRNSTARAKELLAAASKAEEDLDRVEKQQARTMLNDVRRAERSATERVRSMERASRRAAAEWKAAGRKVESATRATKSASERAFEGAMGRVEESEERLRGASEDTAEQLQGRLEAFFDDVNDQVEDRIDALQQRRDERREKTRAELSKFAETRMMQTKEGRSATSFLEGTASSDGAKGLVFFSAGFVASLAGTALLLRRRLPAATAPLLG